MRLRRETGTTEEKGDRATKQPNYLGMVIDSYLFGLVGPTAKQALAL